MHTIRYILEHPEEFNPEDLVVVVGKAALAKPEKPKRPKVRTMPKNPRTHFELYGIPNGNGTYHTIGIHEFEHIKKITGLTAEESTISYQCDFVWFVTSSQKVLNKINKEYGTSFRFNDMNHIRDYVHPIEF